MFEDLFEEPKAKEKIPSERGMFEGLFKEPSLEEPKGIMVSLTEDLKGLKIVDTGEVIERKNLTPEMKKIKKDLLGQLLEAQKEAGRKLPPITFWEQIKAMPKKIGKILEAPVPKLLTEEEKKFLPGEIVKTIRETPERLKWATILSIPKIRDKYIEKNPDAVIEFVDDYEEIVGPFVRKMYPTRIPLAVAEKITGKKLVATFEELKEKNPVATEISGLMGDIYNLISLSALTGGISNYVTVPKWAIATFPYLTRFVPTAAHFGATWGLKGVLDESLSQFEKGEFEPKKIATEGGKEALFGALLAGAYVFEAPAVRILTMGTARGGWTALETYLREGKITSEDMPNIGANTILGLIFGAMNAKGVTTRFKQQKFDAYLHRHAVIRTGLPEKEAEQIVAVIEKIGGLQKLPPAIIQQITKQIPSTLKNLSAIEQVKMADQIMKIAKTSIDKGMPAWDSVIKALQSVGFPKIEIPIEAVKPIKVVKPKIPKEKLPKVKVLPAPKVPSITKLGPRTFAYQGKKITIKESPEAITALAKRAGVPRQEYLNALIKERIEKLVPIKEVKPPITKPKLPKIKKPPIKKEVKLYVGMPDPGVDKFLAEEVRPVLNKATEAGKYLWRETKVIPELMMRIVEPAKLVAGEPYATVIRGIHKPEARLVEFDQKRLETFDSNISELEKWFNKFSDKDLGNLMLTRGKPMSAEALTIQRNAIKEILKEFKVPAITKSIQEIADFNYKFLQTVAGKDIHKVEDYFYGMYKNPKMVSKFLDYWRSTERFIKQKKLPTVADAEAYGLELRDKNPVTNLRAEYRAIAKLEGMIWMREELLRTGKGIYIEEIDKAPVKWEKVNDPLFRELRVEPNLARLINNLIATNKITRVPVLNALRKINNFLRTLKFIGSAFHLGVIAKQSVADSGYLGFTYKKTAIRGATFGFRKYDSIFRTTEYKEYIELGGGHKYSVEFEAKRVLVDLVDKVNRGNYLGAFTKLGIIPAKLPVGFVNWMFNSYIPKVKYAKYLDFVAKKEKTDGRMITDKEKIEIIKEGQNFYGMMNERLFGRSGTVTTALRFFFMAPGFAEGNYRTIIKAFSQWGIKGTYGAGRSRFNIVNSLILTAILATVGTLILKKKWPKKPEKLEDIRDLFKIDTGYVDDRDRRIMIDLLTYDKDYWNITFNVLKGRPDKAVTESVRRIGGMKAPTAEMLTDFALMLQGRAIYDWKEDKIMELTDPFLIKLQKLAIHEIRRLEPISVSVYKQTRNKEVDMALSFVIAVVGARLAKTEEDKRTQKIISRIYSLKGQQEELYQYLGTINEPKKAIENYNKMVNDILDSKMVPTEMREEWKPKLLVDIDRLLSNKVYQLTGPMTKLTDAEKEKEIERIKKYLQNFEVSMEEVEEYLKYYWKEHPVKDKWSKTHRANVKNRKARLEERF